MSEQRRSFFDWVFGREREGETPTRGRPRRPAPRDMTGGFVANEEMEWGLYHGDYRGLQYASPLAGVPVDTMVNMIGLPTPVCKEDDVTQAALDEITKLMADRIKEIHTAHFVVGTPWVWPRFDSDSGALVWEDLPDSTVADILINIVTGKPGAILTDEQIQLAIAENQVAFVQRKRRFEAGQVSVQYFGQKPESVQDYTARNVSGILPIPFPHNARAGEIRGWSLYAPGIRVAKSYHDVLKMQIEILSQFKPKQIQDVEDVKDWIKNNIGEGGLELLQEYDVAGADFIINRTGKNEKTDFKHLPADATAGFEKAINYLFILWVQSTGLPEMVWGQLATGNNATVETDYQRLMTIIAAKMRDMTTPHYQLYSASLRLLSIVRGVNYKPFEMAWDKLDAISADVKSQIFLRFAQSVASLAGTATITVEMLHKLWTIRYPELEPGTFDEFLVGITKMGLHKQFVGLDYASGLADFQGGEAGAMGEPAGQGALGGKGGAK